MKRKIEALQNQIGSISEQEAGESESADPELEKVLTENTKLKYQVETLKRVRMSSCRAIAISIIR